MARTILANATIVDGCNPPRNGTLVISGDSIEAVCEGPVAAAPHDRHVDLGGRTVMPGILARTVVHAMVAVIALQANECAMLIGHNRRTLGNILADDRLQALGGKVRGNTSAQFAAPLKDAEDRDLALAALLAPGTLGCVLIFLLTADECLIGLYFTIERAVERLRADRVAQAMSDKPCGFLRDTEVLGELRARNPLLMGKGQRNHRLEGHLVQAISDPPLAVQLTVPVVRPVWRNEMAGQALSLARHGHSSWLKRGESNGRRL